MPPSVRIEQKPGYLHVSVAGENSRENVIAYMEAVHAACTGRKCRAVLIEEDLKGPSLGVMDIYEIISKGSSQVRLAISTIAYVDVNPEHDMDRMKFAETVAVNRSVRIRLFTSVAEAARWLEEVVRP